MSKQKSVVLADLEELEGSGMNEAVDVSRLESASMFVSGTFEAVFTIEESADGENFAALEDNQDLEAGGIFPLNSGTKLVRINCTDYTSGTIVSQVGGRDQEVKDLG